MTPSETKASHEAVIWDGDRNSYRPGEDWQQQIAGLPLHKAHDDELDPVTYRVIRNRLWTINTAHGETVTRVSGSPVFASFDFNMCILTEDADIVMNAPFIQYLNVGAPYSVRFVMERFGSEPGIEEGDIFVGNDPWVGAVHQMDVLFACPVFVDGQIFAWVSNAGHQYDLGGVVAGGWPQNALDVYHDPVLLSPFKLVERGVLRKDLERMYLRQSRTPDLVALDLRAQIAGCRFAAEQIKQVCARYGAGTVKAVMRRIVDSAQDAFAEKLRRIPDGTWSGVRYLEDALPGDRKLYRMELNLRKQGDRLSVDNAGSEEQQPGPLGITFQALAGSLLSAIAITMLPEQLFALGGAERQISYQVEPGLLSTVQYPAAISAAISNVVTHLNLAQGCIARMLATDDELRRDLAAPCAEYPVPVIVGHDDEGNFFGSAVLDHFAMGGGARSFQDGVDSGGPAWSPLTFLLNVEAVESWFPMIYVWRRELEDSGGPGRWRGGVGLAYAFAPYRAAEMDVNSFAGGMSMSGYSSEGVLGGYPSPPSRTTLKRGTPLASLPAARLPLDIDDVEAAETQMLSGKSNAVALGPGDITEAIIGGGGGYGDPLEREPWRVVEDVRNLRVSAAAASSVYAVALGEGGELDEDGTERLRAAAREDRAGWEPAGVLGEPEAPAATRPASGEPARRVHEAVVARDEGAERVLACERCDTVLCGYADNLKEHLLVSSAAVKEGVFPRANDASTYIDDADVVFRRYCCPGCQVLISTEIVRGSEPVLLEMRLK